MNFRLRAFSFHLLASIFIAVVAILWVFGVWYPAPLHQAVGLTEIFLLLLAVDVSLGPLLTLLVAKEGKPSLKKDLLVIIALQLSALTYGLYVVAEGRPVWLVLNDDQIDLIQAFEMDNLYRDEAKPDFRSLSWTGPRWVSVREPEDLASQEVLKFETVFAGVDLSVRADLFLPFEAEAERLSEASLPLEDLYKHNTREEVDAILARWPDADAYLPMTAFINYLTVLVNKESREVVAIVPLKPS